MNPDTSSTVISTRFPIREYRSDEQISAIFAVNGTDGRNGGFKTLVELIGENGLKFFQSPTERPLSGTAGLIDDDDVVLIKVNSQWDQRGGTNTDLLRQIIQLIVDHPEGWNGEIIVADNGQAQYGASGYGGSLDWTKNNAEDPTQSVQDVVNDFAGKYRVSTYLWDNITSIRVREYSQGVDVDGYVVEEGKDPETGLIVSYPKFTTKFGTNISFKYGIWDPSSRKYDSDILKILNVPVLKSHSIYGVTGAVKHYMGIPSDKLTRDLGSRTHSTIRDGSMGTLMAETRFPTLNIIDAIWVNCQAGTGPSNSYTSATRLNVIAASTDPIALDYWASKNILLEASKIRSGKSALLDPDNDSPGFFGSWLRLSAEELIRAGYKVTLDENKMSIFVREVK